MPTAKNDSEFYRSDLSHAVSTLGAALRSLERMGDRGGTFIVGIKLRSLQEELKELREKEKNGKV